MHSVIRKMSLYLGVRYMYMQYVPERAVATLRFIVQGRLRAERSMGPGMRQTPGGALTRWMLRLDTSLHHSLLSSHLIQYAAAARQHLEEL
jgi:hypothetical protein